MTDDDQLDNSIELETNVLPPPILARFGAQSMVSTLRTVLMVPPGGATTRVRARSGWLPQDHAKAQAQFELLVELLGHCDVDVIETKPSPRGNPDAVFAFDPVLITGAGVIAMRMSKQNRRDEPARLVAEVERWGIPLYGGIQPPGTMDAGDVLWLSESEVAVGIGWRTNRAAAGQLAALLDPLGVRVDMYDLPYFRGPGHCLHLMSLISMLGPKLAAVHQELLPVALWRRLDELGIRFLPSAPDEFDNLATNVLALGKQRVVALKGNPTTLERLDAAGLTVHTFDGPDLCLAGTGGPTCVTRPLYRNDEDD